MLLQYPDTFNLIQGSPTRIELIAPFTWVLKVYDEFTAPDGTLLLDHVISPTNSLGAAWTSGDIRITSNRLTYQGS